MNRPAPFTAALEHKFPESLELLKQMVGINSYTSNIEGVNALAKYTAQCFAPLGFTSEFVPSVNPNYGSHLVLTRSGSGGKNVALISHLDTVFPPEEERRNNFCWQPEGDRIYGPGTQDIKGGTAMMWLVLSALAVEQPALFQATTWKLIWNSSEETFSPDFGDLCRANFDAATIAALIFEAEGRLDQDHLLVAARKGRAAWKVKISGRAAHAGGKHSQGANAVVQAGRIADHIANFTNYSKNLTFNVATISGGTVLNRVPHEAFIEGEFRTFDPEVFAAAKKELLALSGPGTVVSPLDRYPCEVAVAIQTETRPWPVNPGTEMLCEVWKEAGASIGIKVGKQERGGLSDGNHIWDAVPTVDGLGPWGDNDHCSERSADGSKLPEYVEISSFMPKAILNCAAIMKLMQPGER
jgi:glutamate carboxypeptidase